MVFIINSITWNNILRKILAALLEPACMVCVIIYKILYLGIALVYKLRMVVKNALIQLLKITTKCKLGNGTHKLILLVPPIFILWNSILMFYTAFDNVLNHFGILVVLLALILALMINILVIFLRDHLKLKF